MSNMTTQIGQSHTLTVTRNADGKSAAIYISSMKRYVPPLFPRTLQK